MSNAVTPTPAATGPSWVSPPSRPEAIDTLVRGVDKYNPGNLHLLRDYLFQQAADGTSDPMANLALLKLMQFNTDLFDARLVLHLLLHALPSFPGPTFALHTSLLEQASVPDGPLATYLAQTAELAAALDGCRFPAFWTALEALPRSSPSPTRPAQNNTDDLSDDEEEEEQEMTVMDAIEAYHPQFRASIRASILTVVGHTFQRIPLDRLASYLHLDANSKEFDDLLNRAGWTVDRQAASVTVGPAFASQSPARSALQSTVPASVPSENIQLSQISRLLTQSV